MIKIGFIGAGGNCRRKHIPKLRAIQGVEVVGVCNRSEASSRAVCDEFGLPTVYPSAEALLADDALDAVVIGTWPYMHKDYTLAALAADKHVMVEARMAMNAAEAEAMLAASRAKPSLVTQVVPAPGTLMWDDHIARWVDEELGGLIHVETGGLGGGFIETTSPITWRLRREYSGNNIMGVGIGYESMMRWVGPLASVNAQARIHVTQRPAGEGGGTAKIDVPDLLTLMGTLQRDDATFTHSSSRNVAGGEGGCPNRIFGRRATVTVRGKEPPLLTRAGQEPIAATDPGPGWRVEEEFIGAIRGEETIRFTTFETGVRYMRFTDAIHESLANHGAAAPIDNAV